MANEEHVRRLRDEGVEAWNAWRETKPGVRPNLASTNLNDDYHAAFQRLLRNLKTEESSAPEYPKEPYGKRHRPQT